MRLCLVLLSLFATTAYADTPKTIDVPDKDGSVYHVPADNLALLEAVRAKVAQRSAAPMPAKAAACAGGSCGALDDLNAKRAARGLKPYIADPQLTQAAEAAATYRAANCIEGHCDDFSFLPHGVHAAVAGCAAWPIGMGFGACAVFENYTFAGAAWVIGKDGRRYCHLFAR